MMTKQDFEAIAHTLDANQAPLALVQDFADMLAEQNPRFNKRLFVAAATQKLHKQTDYEKYVLDVAHGKV